MVEHLKVLYPNLTVEVKNPLVHTDDKDAVRRLYFYGNHGFKIINPKYSRPALTKKGKTIKNMFLMSAC